MLSRHLHRHYHHQLLQPPWPPAWVLTSFITMLSGTGGNSGSQSSVAVIRALSLDEIDFSDLVAVVWKEIRVAVLCGVCLAAANFVKMMVVDRWLMHNPEVTPLVALVVCLTWSLPCCAPR